MICLLIIGFFYLCGRTSEPQTQNPGPQNPFTVEGSAFNVHRSGFSVQRSEFRAQTAGLPARNTKPSTLSSVPGNPWRIGQSVMHEKFGAGVIVSAEGAGAEARVQVNFRSTGLKWLMLEYAKLTPA